MEISGKVKEVLAINKVSDKFQKRDLILTVDGKYPQLISIQFNQDKVDLLKDLNIGADITVQINIRGREWTSPQGEVKYFNTIEGWRIEGAGSPEIEAKPVKGYDVSPINGGEEDDLPF